MADLPVVSCQSGRRETPPGMSAGPLPGRLRQAWHHIQVERDRASRRVGRGDAADDHEFNVMVVKLAQNVEKVARHAIAVPRRPRAVS